MRSYSDIFFYFELNNIYIENECVILESELDLYVKYTPLWRIARCYKQA